ncbi:MAG: carboxypeptidase-like regulatory domain-containing protein, partial [Candidatus Electryoneaceae bacterium]|nr:carboxypeptidase-like regulatory domain-containing protein [Candidatus Electryoneaceae bacterium]
MDGITHTKTNNSLCGGITRGIRYFDLHQPGVLQHFSKFQMESDYRFDENDRPVIIETLAAYRLFGDPSINIFYATPDELAAEHPDEIVRFTNGLNIYVTIDDEPAPDALVCMWNPVDEGVHLVTTPGDDGWARFTFAEDDIPEEGSLLLTITRPNAIPYIAAIEVAGEGIVMDDVDFNFNETTLFGEQIDNDDELFGNGYTIPTVFSIWPTSGDRVNDVVVSLSSEDELISFDPQELELGDVDDETLVEFDISFNRASRQGREILVNVDVTADDGDRRWEHSFQIPTSGHNLEIQLVEGDIDPGRASILELSLRNVGDLDSPELTATLVYLPEEWREDWVEITRNTATYRSIHPNQTLDQSGGRLQVNVSDLAIPGNYAKFMITLEAQDDNDDFCDTLYFEREIGNVVQTDPVGPDAYGYICFDSHDGGNWDKAPQFQWREINPAIPDYDFEGERLELGDIYVDYDSSGVIVFPEEFNFQYYGQEFDTMIVNSNGWIAFGADQSMYVDFRNWQIPGNQGPDAQVCALWQDLINPQPGDRGVFTYYDEAAGIYIIEWSEIEIYSGPQDLLEFQIILYDSEQWATRTGDGEIKIQYKHVAVHQGDATDNFFSTVGLKNLDGSDGMEYCYWNHYADAAWPLEDELALLFTTEVELIVGAVEGQVTDASTNEPIEGAEVLVVPGGEDMVVTDAQGHYRTENVRVGPNYVQVSLYGYNTARRNVDIIEGETIQIDIALTHPEINVPGDEIHRDIRQQETAVASLQIGNDGNGPLTVNVSTRYEDGSPVTYAYQNSIPVSELVEDERIYGCQFVWDLLYVTGSNRMNPGEDTSLTNWVYVFDKEGNETTRLRQHTHGTMSFHDLAWDGRYLYGGEERTDSTSWLVAFDNQGRHIRDYIIEILNEDLNFPRAIAYSPSRQTLFIASEGSHIYEIALDGENIEIVDAYRVRLPGEDISIYGMAWNEMDHETPLYIMDRTPTDDSGEMRLIKYNPETRRTRIVKQLAQYDTETGTGLSF